MTVEEEETNNPLPGKQIPSEKDEACVVSLPISSHPDQQETSSANKKLSPKELIILHAGTLSFFPINKCDPSVWGALTAINRNSRFRKQGMNIYLTADEHRIGQSVKETHFQIEVCKSYHCKIYRKIIANEDVGQPCSFCISAFLEDFSIDGTYLNWEKLKSRTEAKIQHGDIISFNAPPDHELAFAFVYRVNKHNLLMGGANLKRKADVPIEKYELRARLGDKQNQRRDEQEESLADIKTASRRAQAEDHEELDQQSIITPRQERELQEEINKLKESEKECHLHLETLRSELADTRKSFAISESKVRRLEVAVHGEQLASVNCKKIAKELEHGMERLKKELERRKAE